MLSRMTFSLVFVLLLGLVVGPAAAQVFLSPNLNHNVDSTPSSVARAEAANDGAALQERRFVVYQRKSGANGLNAGAITTVEPNTNNSQFPDLYDFLVVGGGTIELIVRKTVTASGPTNELTGVTRHGMAITEIMWGRDAARTGSSQTLADAQWIEIFNEVSINLFKRDDVRLLFTYNRRVERNEVTLKDGAVTDYPDSGLYGDAGTATNPNIVAPNAGQAADKDTDIVYTVVDRVCLQNRFGVRWDPKGSSGRSAATTDGDHGIQNLVSMYRKRSTNADRTTYKYAGNNRRTGLPEGDKFADGTESGQWIASAGRINLGGSFVGSPGTVQQVFGGKVASNRNPASLPVGNIIINEIFNSEVLQWIELYNTGTSEVNVKNYELEAWTGKDKFQRVFTVPNKDTKIPGKGFLLITNRDPDNSVLAGGVDLHDSNKFKKGADHLYIVVPKNGDGAKDKNSWMPEKGFLLVLRNGNDKDNHEKVVDIAGNTFFAKTDDNITTDVQPLVGWTVPGNRKDDDWGGGAGDSLKRNTGKTYARIDQKSGGNRVHENDWHSPGAVGGLGYDPKVDMRVAPGTPGYANNGQKNNLAGISSGVATKVVVSELMYDPGDDGRLVQWIELYNSSMVHSVSLKDWKLEVRNIDTDVQSYVDSSLKFDGDAVILPNQTLLLVTDRSSASDVPNNRVYNLYQKHRNDLGLSNRRSVLLSNVGFYLRLLDKDNKVADIVSNIILDGPRRTVDWSLDEDIMPMADDMRRSIVRQFGTRKIDGSADPADAGTMASSWRRAVTVGSHYGHRDDMGSPGHREGSPLPVSLSSFRPVRDAETGAVVIRWTTESELNNAGFNILRSDAKDGEFTVVNVKGLIKGHGTTSEKHTYTWTDTTAKPNVVYYYQIEDVSLDGQRTTLRTTHLRGNVTAGGKLTTVWGDLKLQK